MADSLGCCNKTEWELLVLIATQQAAIFDRLQQTNDVLSSGTAGDATAANQVNCQQTTQIVDAACNAVGVTGGALNVNMTGGGVIELQRAAQPTVTKTVVPVAAVNVAVLAANASRSGLKIQNTGAGPVTITYGAADGSTGMILQPMGVDDGITYDPDVRYTGAVTASWNGSTATSLTVFEWNQA